jgi:drug/metabolite transporter (DMT)-like permease
MEPTSRLKTQLAGVALVNLATLTWATNMTLGRWLRADVGPLTLAAARFTIATPVFVLLCRRPREPVVAGRKDGWLIAGMALIGVVLFGPTLYLGLRYTPVVTATLINGLGPLITGLLAALLIREPMSRAQLAGAVLGLIGVTVLISGGSLAFWKDIATSAGALIVLGAITLWGLYSVLGRKVMRTRSALSATALTTWVGVPFLLVAAAFEVHHTPPSLSPRVLLAIGYIGLVPTVMGFLAWNAGVQRLGASGAMVFYNSLPLYGTLLGVVWLGETVGLEHLIGGGFIIGGGLWAAWKGQSEPRSSVQSGPGKVPVARSD